jgi:hypothetical protein
MMNLDDDIVDLQVVVAYLQQEWGYKIHLSTLLLPPLSLLPTNSHPFNTVIAHSRGPVPPLISESPLISAH